MEKDKNILVIENPKSEFAVGQLYSATSGLTLRGFNQWDAKTIERETTVNKNRFTEYSYSLYKEQRGGKNGLKLGMSITQINSGLIKDSGAADHMNRSGRTKDVQHLVMMFKKMTRSEQLNMDHLINEKKSQPFPRGATHVIGHVEYADYAIFTLSFISEVFKEAEKHSNSVGEFWDWFEDSEDSVSTSEGQQCKVFCSLPDYNKIVLSWEEVVDAYKSIPKYFGKDDSTAIPIKATMYNISYFA